MRVEEKLLKEAWTLAIETLSWMEMERQSERLALARTVKQLSIKDADAVRLAHLLVCETVRRKNFIKKFINKVLSPRDLSEFTLGVQAFLLLFVYQTRIAKKRSKIDIKEAENIAKLGRSILGWKTLRRVEHVLGLLLTERPAVVFENVADEQRIGLLTFHPRWFVKHCFKLFGREETIRMLEANIQSPPSYVRLNTLKGDEDEILESLSKEGVRTEKVEEIRHTYKIVGASQFLTRTQSYKKGLFYIQDKASCFAAETADPKPEMTVLDVCAAPGAKTTYLGQLMQNRGTIYSLDYSKRRMIVWKNEVARTGVEIAVPIIADARNLLPIALEADVVVLDPPCTGTGVFGKSPSAKWRLTNKSIDKMAEVQWQMLDNCALNVKLGGTLIYSTCSITVEENEMLIERFLKWHSEFSLTDIAPKMGLPGLRGMEKCQRLYPHIHDCNGFFITKIVKEK